MSGCSILTRDPRRYTAHFSRVSLITPDALVTEALRRPIYWSNDLWLGVNAQKVVGAMPGTSSLPPQQDAYGNPLHDEVTYANPLLDHDFPAPAILRAADGYYYAYVTQSDVGDRRMNIQAARSPHLRKPTRAPVPSRHADGSNRLSRWLAAGAQRTTIDDTAVSARDPLDSVISGFGMTDP